MPRYSGVPSIQCEVSGLALQMVDEASWLHSCQLPQDASTLNRQRQPPQCSILSGLQPCRKATTDDEHGVPHTCWMTLTTRSAFACYMPVSNTLHPAPFSLINPCCTFTQKRSTCRFSRFIPADFLLGSRNRFAAQPLSDRAESEIDSGRWL